MNIPVLGILFMSLALQKIAKQCDLTNILYKYLEKSSSAPMCIRMAFIAYKEYIEQFYKERIHAKVTDHINVCFTIENYIRL